MAVMGPITFGWPFLFPIWKRTKQPYFLGPRFITPWLWISIELQKFPAIWRKITNDGTRSKSTVPSYGTTTAGIPSTMDKPGKL